MCQTLKHKQANMNMKTKLLLLTFVAALSSAISAADARPYPLKVCIVSGNELGSMGKVITKVHDGQEVKFCCKPCIKKFDANPAKYLAKLK